MSSGWGAQSGLKAEGFVGKEAELIAHVGSRLARPMETMMSSQPAPRLDWPQVERVLARGRDFAAPMPESERLAWEAALRGSARKEAFHPPSAILKVARSHIAGELARLPASAAMCALRDDELAKLARERLPERSTLWGAALAVKAIQGERQAIPQRLEEDLFAWAAELSTDPEGLEKAERSAVVGALSERIRAWPLFAQQEGPVGERARALMGGAATPAGRQLLAQAFVAAVCHGDMNAPRGERLIELALSELGGEGARRALILALNDDSDLLRPNWAARGPAARRLNPWEPVEGGGWMFPIFDEGAGIPGGGGSRPCPLASRLMECFGEPSESARWALANESFKRFDLAGGLWWAEGASAPDPASQSAREALESAQMALWDRAAALGGWSARRELKLSPGPAEVESLERSAVWLDQTLRELGVGGASQELLSALSTVSPALAALAEARALQMETQAAPKKGAARAMAL